MSTLISSAVGGRKAAAPKGAVRRRQPPPPGAPEKAVVPVTVPSAQSSVAPPSPPPTQVAEITAIPSSEGILPSASRFSNQPEQTTPISLPTSSTTIEQTVSGPSAELAEVALAKEAQVLNSTEILPPAEQTSSAAPISSRKRKQTTEHIGEETTEPPRKAKRSTAKGNDKASITDQEVEVVEPTVINAPTAQFGRAGQQKPSAEANDDATASAAAPKSRANKQAAEARFQLTPSTATKKRKAEPVKETTQTQPAKKAKRSSARSNNMVQAAAEQEESATVAASASKATQKKAMQKQTVPAIASSVPNERPATRKAQSKSKETPVALRNQAKQQDTPASQTSRTKAKATASVAKPGAKKGPKQKVTAIPIDPAVEAESLAQPKSKQKRQRRARQSAQELEQAGAENEQEFDTEGDHDSDDESDPELHELDPNTVTMWEVGGSKRHGKTSEREKKMAAIDWGEVKQKRLEEIQRIVAGEQATQPQAVSKAPDDGAVQSIEGADGTAATPPVVLEDEDPQQLIIRNGEIVENEEIQQIDRRKLVEKEIAEHTEPIVEDTDLTTRMNRTTYIHSRKRDPKERLPMSKAKSDPWSEEETEKFYEALRMFGTDFFIISQMFPPKTRRQIKMKFVREERLDPVRIDRALGVGSGGGAAFGGRKEMDLEHYAREVGTEVEEFSKFESLEEAEAEIRESYAAQVEAAEKARQELEEFNNAAQNEEGQREADKNAKNAKKQKQQASRKKGEGQAQRGRKKAVGEATKGKKKQGEVAAEPKRKKAGRPKKGAKAATTANAPVSEVVEVADD